MAAARLRQRVVSLSVQEDGLTGNGSDSTLKMIPACFLWEEMHCRHMTIQNEPNMSCLQWSVVTL